MSAPSDKFGRPIVVVTGMGVVTSLGAGKADNWRKLTAGESGIRTVTRFPIDGLKSTMAGTVDFVTVDPVTSTGLTERLAEMATEEALEQAAIGAKADFPGPLFLAVAPVEVEWPQRLELGRAIGKTEFGYDDMLRVSGGGRFTAYHRRFMFGSVASHLAEASAPRARRSRCRRLAPPARPRSSSASRRSAAAMRMRRCASRPMARSIRKLWCGSRCCRLCRRRTIRRGPPPSRSPRTATAL